MDINKIWKEKKKVCLDHEVYYYRCYKYLSSSVVLPKQHDLMDFFFSKLKKRGPRFFTSAELGDKKRRNPEKAQSIIFF